MSLDFIDKLPFLTFQERRILKENAQDLFLWDGVQIDKIWNEESALGIENKRQAKDCYNRVLDRINKMRLQEIDYDSFSPIEPVRHHTDIVKDFKAPDKIMGRCPCPSESPRLRCCNLKTLDAVQQCPFGCAYCSIQSFYSPCIRIVSDLDEKLSQLADTLSPDIWHIGTGQSSDSLFLGNDYGTITALSHFAEKRKDIIIELKTKSARTDWLSEDIPRNIIATWSVNANSVVQKEEHFTASLRERINSAKKCVEAGRLVGFHIHPVVWFKGWKQEYSDLVKLITDSVPPENVVMIGMGTLTFTKQNLKVLREGGQKTMVTHIPFAEAAGKYSYPISIKQEMFSYIAGLFPKQWHDNVFFYLCMEDKDLWLQCLGREYATNAEFEEDMKRCYFAKLQ